MDWLSYREDHGCIAGSVSGSLLEWLDTCLPVRIRKFALGFRVLILLIITNRGVEVQSPGHATWEYTVCVGGEMDSMGGQ